VKRYREIQKRREGRESSERGFTLIELLIVIVVLGILAAIVIFSLTGVTGQSNAAACNADGKSIEIAADAYSASNGGNYPTQSGDVVGTGSGSTASYLQSWPSVDNGIYTFGFGTQTVNLYKSAVLVGPYTTSCSAL
jgi:general secretion pathway protein G